MSHLNCYAGGMRPPSCQRKAGLCPWAAVCHLWASEAETLSSGIRGVGCGGCGGSLGTTVNVQTIYQNKSCGVKRKRRHRKQMNKKHQLPCPDLDRPGPKHTFHTKWLQIGSDKSAAERRALTRLPTKHFLGPGQTEEGAIDGDWGER